MIPAKRQRTVTIDFEDEINTAADAARASSAIVSACVSGEISFEEANQMIGLIQTHVTVLQSADLEERMAHSSCPHRARLTLRIGGASAFARFVCKLYGDGAVVLLWRR